MPSPTVMRARGRKIDEAIGRPPLTEEERERRKKDKGEKEQTVAPWMIGLFMFIVLGSAVLQIFQTIQTSPSMSDEH